MPGYPILVTLFTFITINIYEPIILLATCNNHIRKVIPKYFYEMTLHPEFELYISLPKVLIVEICYIQTLNM